MPSTISTVAETVARIEAELKQIEVHFEASEGQPAPKDAPSAESIAKIRESLAGLESQLKAQNDETAETLKAIQSDITTLAQKGAGEKDKKDWTLYSICVTAIVALLTIGAGFYSQYLTNKDTTDLKAGEIMIGSGEYGFYSPDMRFEILNELYGDRLSKQFKDDNLKKFIEACAGSHYLISQKELIHLISEHPDSEETIVRVWGDMLPKDRVNFLDDFVAQEKQAGAIRSSFKYDSDVSKSPHPAWGSPSAYLILPPELKHELDDLKRQRQY